MVGPKLGSVSDNINRLLKEKADRQVTTYILGGTNIIGSREFTQIGNIEIRPGDWAALAEALKKIGVDSAAIGQLKTAVNQDAAEREAHTQVWESGRKTMNLILRREDVKLYQTHC